MLTLLMHDICHILMILHLLSLFMHLIAVNSIIEFGYVSPSILKYMDNHGNT